MRVDAVQCRGVRGSGGTRSVQEERGGWGVKGGEGEKNG